MEEEKKCARECTVREAFFCTCFIHFFVSTFMKLRSIFLKTSSSFGNAPEAKELSGSELTSFLKP